MRRAAFALAALLAFASPAQAAPKQSGAVVIGSKNFTEAVILGEIGAALGRQAGVEVEHRRQLGGTRILWRALEDGSIDAYASTVDDAVRRVTQATGLPPVIVAHSMGGLATRAWLRAFSADARVHRVITLGTPHGGTWLGRWSQATNGRQMQQASPWLQQLQLDEPLTRARLFTCWYSNCDNIVFPARTAALPGARQRFVAGVAHVEMACDEQVMAECLEEMAQAN